jgi:peroxiredoxin
MKPIRIVAIAALVLGFAGATAVTLGRHDAAPVVSYTLLDGSQHRSDALRGKVVLVNFWATSCTVCVKEMPALMTTYRQFQGRGFETLAVAMRYDPPAYVVNYAHSRELPFPVAIDNTGEIARRFGDVQLTPTTFVINRRGEIVKRYVGAPDFAELHSLLDRLLSES